MNEIFDEYLPKMITIGKAAKFLGITTKTLRVWDKEGKLSPIRTQGNHRRYLLSDIKKLMEKGKDA